MDYTMIPLAQLSIDNFKEHSVWEFALENEEEDDTLVRPVLDLPVDDLSNRVVGTKIQLNNKTRRWALLSNISLNSQEKTVQFITVAIEENGAWFDLARYFDAGYARRGPAQLADFLKLKVGDVFPMKYDISKVAIGLHDVIHGVIPKEPPTKLSSDQLIDMSLHD